MNRLKIWLRVSRFNFLPTSLLPYGVGVAAAWAAGAFRPSVFLLGLLGTVLVHVTANLFNEYWDDRFRADSAEGDYLPHSGGSKAIQTGLVSPRAVLRAARVCLIGGLLLGVVLSLILKTFWLLPLIFIGAFIAWAYTAPPFSFAYRGLGEIALGVAFGPLLVMGGYLLQTGELTARVVPLSLPSGFLIAAVLIANEFADAGTDSRAGKRNLVVRAGPGRSLDVFRFCLLGAYLVPAAAWAAGLYPLPLLAFILSAPPAWSASRLLAGAVKSGRGFEESSARFIRLYFLFHLLLIGGILLS